MRFSLLITLLIFVHFSFLVQSQQQSRGNCAPEYEILNLEQGETEFPDEGLRITEAYEEEEGCFLNADIDDASKLLNSLEDKSSTVEDSIISVDEEQSDDIEVVLPTLEEALPLPTALPVLEEPLLIPSSQRFDDGLVGEVYTFVSDDLISFEKPTEEDFISVNTLHHYLAARQFQDEVTSTVVVQGVESSKKLERMFTSLLHGVDLNLRQILRDGKPLDQQDIEELLGLETMLSGLREYFEIDNIALPNDELFRLINYLPREIEFSSYENNVVEQIKLLQRIQEDLVILDWFLNGLNRDVNSLKVFNYDISKSNQYFLEELTDTSNNTPQLVVITQQPRSFISTLFDIIREWVIPIGALWQAENIHRRSMKRERQLEAI